LVYTLVSIYKKNTFNHSNDALAWLCIHVLYVRAFTYSYWAKLTNAMISLTMWITPSVRVVRKLNTYTLTAMFIQTGRMSQINQHGGYQKVS